MHYRLSMYILANSSSSNRVDILFWNMSGAQLIPIGILRYIFRMVGLEYRFYLSPDQGVLCNSPCWDLELTPIGTFVVFALDRYLGKSQGLRTILLLTCRKTVRNRIVFFLGMMKVGRSPWTPFTFSLYLFLPTCLIFSLRQPHGHGAPGKLYHILWNSVKLHFNMHCFSIEVSQCLLKEDMVLD